MLLLLNAYHAITQPHFSSIQALSCVNAVIFHNALNVSLLINASCAMLLPNILSIRQPFFVSFVFLKDVPFVNLFPLVMNVIKDMD